MSQHIILHLIIFFQMLESLETIIRKKKQNSVFIWYLSDCLCGWIWIRYPGHCPLWVMLHPLKLISRNTLLVCSLLMSMFIGEGGVLFPHFVVTILYLFYMCQHSVNKKELSCLSHLLLPKQYGFISFQSHIVYL